MLDPGTIGLAIKAMQMAYQGIEYCCEALSDGKVQVQKIKKATEDAKTIVADVKSVWVNLRDVFRSVFGGNASKPSTQQTTEQAKPSESVSAPKKEEFIRHVPDEGEIVQQFVKHVGDFYQHHRDLSEYYEQRFDEVYAMDRPDPRDILELSVIRNELDGAYMKLSGMMRGAHVPSQLGPLWDNFHKIYEDVQEAQRDRKERERIHRNNERWQREQAQHLLLDRALAVVGVVLVLLWTWPVTWLLGSLVRTHSGFRG